MPVRAMVWITDSNWRACVDAARAWIPEQAEITLLNVSDDEAADVVHGAFAGLLGRSHPTRDPSRQMKALDAAAAADLLDAAADRLGRSATPPHRHGRVEHEGGHATAGADLLLCAPDGERHRPGPHPPSPATPLRAGPPRRS